ncbi:MAG: 50S ribosomal protein L7ae [Firmicutes bacterium]|nr:50S ribosomal protein L7ae [Bacillota bacterium]
MTVDNGQLLSLLGLCRAASLCSFGHGAAKSSLREGKARLCLLCADASPRLAEEFQFLAESAAVPLRNIAATSLDIKHATQYKAAVITINDKGFAHKILALTP